MVEYEIQMRNGGGSPVWRALLGGAIAGRALTGCAGDLDVGGKHAECDLCGYQGDTAGAWRPGAEAPVVQSVATMDCSNTTGGELWVLQVVVDDPQGAWTVVNGDVGVIMPSGSERARYALVCENGVCSGSFLASYDDIPCDMRGRVSFAFVVQDEDGNVSEVFTAASGGG